MDTYGDIGITPDDLFCVADDAQCGEMLAVALSKRNVPKPVWIAHGELKMALGLSDSAPSPGSTCVVCPVDALRVIATAENGKERMFVAVSNVIARDWWWRGELQIVTNSGYANGWEVCPRAHPGDGRFDHLTVDAEMSLMQRMLAWRKLRTRTHLPHLNLHVKQSIEVKFHWDLPLRLTVDGVDRGRYETVAIELIPNALRVCSLII